MLWCCIYKAECLCDVVLWCSACDVVLWCSTCDVVLWCSACDVVLWCSACDVVLWCSSACDVVLWCSACDVVLWCSACARKQGPWGPLPPFYCHRGALPPPLTFIQYDLYTILKFMSGPQPIDTFICTPHL